MIELSRFETKNLKTTASLSGKELVIPEIHTRAPEPGAYPLKRRPAQQKS